MNEGKGEKLGNGAKPLNYNILLEPNLRTFKYKGREIISIEIKNSTKSIKLNSAKLIIRNASLISNGNIQKANVKENQKLEQITLRFRNAVSGKAQIEIEFEGTNRDDLRGFYRSKYTDNGKTEYILTSQFEPNDAREAFPCFDEPAFKATFDVSLIIDKNLSVVSNMPQRSERSISKGKKLVVFHTTPKMSSYLLYLGVGKFEFVTSKEDGLPGLRIVTVPGKSKDAGMAMSMTRRFLRFFESYFGIKYPLPKLDLLAIPDFSANAMENWGAMAFRETALLGNEKDTSILAKQKIAEVIAHELAHQWFGDLVTMEWWDDLWLNESFATFMSYKAMHEIYPEWQMDVQYVLDKTIGALGADQLSCTQPVGMKVNSPADMSIAFDPNIVYSKGGCILAMLEDYATKEVFRKGLHNYLKEHSYSNARGRDLWNSIGKAAGKAEKELKFDRVAAYWINRAGYPIVEVRYSKNRLELRQSRFLLVNRRDENIWPIPIHYIKVAEGNKKEGRMLFDKKLRITNEKGLDYIKLNHMQKGFYRVKYSEGMLQTLGGLIKSGDISALDGWGIENDLFSIVRSGRMRVKDYLDFVERYCSKAGYPLDSSISGHLNGLSLLLSENVGLYNVVKRFNLRYHRSILEKLGWKDSEGERNVTALLRSRAIMALGVNGDREVIARAVELFDRHLNGGEQINSNIRGAVYCINAHNGNLDTYKRFLELFKKERVPEERQRLLGALSRFNSPDIINRALDFSLSKEVRLQDAFMVPNIVSSTIPGKKLIWGWTRKNWQRIMGMYDMNTNKLHIYVANLSLTDGRKSMLEIKRFFANGRNMRGDIRLAVRQALELMEVNIRFGEFNE
jgi:tricorn protease interacting factor F2/3